MVFWLSLLTAGLTTFIFAGYLQRRNQKLRARWRWRAGSQPPALKRRQTPLVPAYVVATVAACLRAGMSTTAAWEAALADSGVTSTESALELPEFSSVTPSINAAMRLSETVGIGLADSLDAIVGTLEDAEEGARLLEVAQAGPQATARLLGFLPWVGMGIAYLVGADPLQFFFSSTAGLVVLAVGSAFWWAGKAWVKKLVRKLTGVKQLGVDPVVAVRLLEACLQAGLAVPRSLETVGKSCGEPGLEVIARYFLLGAAPLEVHEFLQTQRSVLTQQLGMALIPAWARGANPLTGLELVAQRLKKERAQQVQVATQRLAVWLALPLGLCFLPAFILLGVVPVAWVFFMG
ncbi:MAG: type II secretion system F family protein [Actinomycetaceae bacterium]|nr:type II secretion system F family protein [Actinomycetaceae bacterium]